MSGLSKLFNRPRKSQSTPTKSFGCLPSKLSSSIPMNKRHTTTPTASYQNQQHQQRYVMDNLDFVPRPVKDTGATITTTESIKPIKKNKSYNAPLTVRNPTPDDYFYMSHSLADTPSREQVTRYTLVDNKSSAPMRKPTPFAHTNQNRSSTTYSTPNAEQAEDVMEEVNKSLGWSDYNRENKQQKQQQHGKTFSTDPKSELEKMKQQLQDIQKERAEFKQQEKRHKRREKRMHQQILETREQLDSLLLSHSYEENNNNNDINFRATSREYNTTSSSYTERPMLVKRNSVGSSIFFQKQQQHHKHSHYHQTYQPQYWYNEPSYHHQHHSYTSPSSSYFPPSLYQRYGSSLDNIYLVDNHDHSPSHYSQSNWNQQRSSYQTPPSYFYDEPERVPKDEIRRKASYIRRLPIPDWSYQ